MAIRNRFTQACNAQHPLVVAGLGLVGMTPDLAVAACEARAIGSVGIGAMPPPAMRQLIQAVRAQTPVLTLFAMPDQMGSCRRPCMFQPSSMRWRLSRCRRRAGSWMDVAWPRPWRWGPTGCGSGLGWSPRLRRTLTRSTGGVWSRRPGRIPTGPQSSVRICPNSILVGFSATESSRSSRVLRNRVIEEYLGRESEVPRDLSSQPVIRTLTLGGKQQPMRRFNNFSGGA